MAGNQDSRKVGSISVEGIERTKRVVEQAERTPLGGVGPSRQANPWTYGTVRAKVTTAVPTGTFESPSSSGRAQIYVRDSSGAWVAWRDPVEVWNDNTMPSPLPVGRAAKLDWIGGVWWLTSASCA
jgi:hypothetical protein